MISNSFKYVLAIFIIAVNVCAFSESTDKNQTAVEDISGESLFLQHCANCHGASGMGQAPYPKVYHCFRCGNEQELTAYISARMPPDRRHDCIGDCATKVAEYILTTINSQPEPERRAKQLTTRRLNRNQYNNTVRDLLGSDLALANNFPEDDFGSGFDRMGDVLSLSPLQFELYVKSAATLASEFMLKHRQQAMDADALTDQNDIPFKNLFDCDFINNRPCLNNAIGEFALKAWRRPITNDELTQLIHLYDEFAQLAPSSGDIAFAGVIQAILSSPNFIFQIEKLPTEKNQPLSQYEIASRLSYFLWDSMPDSELFTLAATEQLLNMEVLQKQVQRMLADEKSVALVDGFFGQWLLLNAITSHYVDSDEVANFNESIQRDMEIETKMVLLDYIRKPLPFKQILNNQYTYANNVMAEFYGFEGEFDADFKKVNLQKYPERFGLLSQGSLLTVTSHPHRTSVVKRGKWVMENFLCEVPPPPPPTVEGLVQTNVNENTTLREKMKAHSADPTCKSCHVTMDAIGFAMENYDAVGLYRTKDNGVKIDTRGAFQNGQKFANAHELSKVLLEDERFTRCVAQKLYIYALSSGVTPNDRLFLKDIVYDWQQSDLSIQALAQAIVTSDAFLRHSPELTNGTALSKQAEQP